MRVHVATVVLMLTAGSGAQVAMPCDMSDDAYGLEQLGDKKLAETIQTTTWRTPRLKQSSIPQTRVVAEPVVNKPDQELVARVVLMRPDRVPVLRLSLVLVLVLLLLLVVLMLVHQNCVRKPKASLADWSPPVVKLFAADPLVAVRPSGVLVPTAFVDLWKERRLGGSCPN